MANDVEEFVKMFGKIPKELKRELRPGLRAAGRVVADDAKLRAAWSTKIPRAIRVSVTFVGKRQGVSIVVNRKKAPNARPIEHGGRAGTFRHPVYASGPRENWTWRPQRARPFLAPALQAKGDDAAKQIKQVVDRVVDRNFKIRRYKWRLLR